MGICLRGAAAGIGGIDSFSSLGSASISSWGRGCGEQTQLRLDYPLIDSIRVCGNHLGSKPQLNSRFPRRRYHLFRFLSGRVLRLRGWVGIAARAGLDGHNALSGIWLSIASEARCSVIVVRPPGDFEPAVSWDPAQFDDLTDLVSAKLRPYLAEAATAGRTCLII